MPSLHPLCCRPYATAGDAVAHSFQCSRIRQSYSTVDNTCFPSSAPSRTCRLILSLHDIRSSYSRILIPSSHHPIIPSSHHPIISSFHPDLSSRLFIPFHYPILCSYFLILHLSCYSGSQGIPSTSISTLTTSQDLTTMLQLPHPISLMLLRLTRDTFNHISTLTTSQHLAAMLRLQALRSPNSYRMYSGLMRDAGEKDQ